ncbi:MAG TPA: hypothetical protein VMM82_12370 [Spirochaetia bacterium]|nr:hypothetical protein [Spirochaetia bacterium]
MIPKFGQKAGILMLLGLMASCGDQSLFMSLNNPISDLQLTTVSDGQVLTDGKGVPLTVSVSDTSKVKDLEMEVTISTPTNGSFYHNRQAVPAVNAQLYVQPPSLPPGQYKMDVVIYSSGEVSQKSTENFFVASGTWKISGIKSYPPVIGSAGKVLLKADLLFPESSDPWLRWSYKGKVIQKGSLSQGLGKILWTAPADEGVYTITLEMFPAAPAETDYSFSSSISLSTDVYVSTVTQSAAGDLGSADSYLSLLRLQGSLDDSGAGAKKLGKTSATAIGSPEIVSTENGFGYRLAGGAGFSLSWLALPVDGGNLQPFTVSFGINLDSFSATNNILAASTSDGSFTFTVSVDGTTHAPQAAIQSGGQSVIVPWSGVGLLTGQRYLLSLSIVPRGQSATALWFLNGDLVATRTVSLPSFSLRQDGTTVVGGPGGFTGVIDEFGVYYRDEKGRPSADPGQFLRAAGQKYGRSLIVASAFEGANLPSGLSTEGRAVMSPGSLTLPPDSALVFAGVNPEKGTISCTVTLSPDSSRLASFRLQWQGDSSVAADIPVTAEGTELKLKISSSGQSILVSSSGGDKTLAIPSSAGSSPSLVMRLVNPQSARTSLTLVRVLMARDKQ